jgi:hypothetical protein
MGLVKQWMIAEHEEDQIRELKEWFFERHGRFPTKREMVQAEDDKEQEEYFEHAMSRND